MTLRLQIMVIIFIVLAVLYIVNQLRKKKLDYRFGLGWLLIIFCILDLFDKRKIATFNFLKIAVFSILTCSASKQTLHRILFTTTSNLISLTTYYFLISFCFLSFHISNSSSNGILLLQLSLNFS